MKLELAPPAPPSPAALALAALALVLAGQWMLALALVGGHSGLADDRPVLSGRHPLHLYHAQLGAATFRARSNTSCYDPAFQAGCPKTPVFDGACRPAELALLVCGNLEPAHAYKLALLLVCLLAPLVGAAAAWGTGAPPPGWVAAAGLSVVVWWSGPVEALLAAGYLDLLGVGLAGLLFVGVLPRYASNPGPLPWALLAASQLAGWYAQPVIWLGLFPVGLLYYAAVAPRHGLVWHLGQVAAFATGLVPNVWWLADWVRFWWLRQTTVDDLSAWPDWPAVLGLATDYADIPGPGLANWAVLGLGLLGLGCAWNSGKRLLVGVVVAAALLAVLFARLAQVWPALAAVSAGRAGTFAVAVFLVPAAHLASAVAAKLRRPAALSFAAGAAVVFAGFTGVGAPDPLEVGLHPDQSELVAALRHHTSAGARILWEDPEHLGGTWNWSALLPALTGRSFLGGLDPEAGVEHSFCQLRAGRLNGRRLTEWTAPERRAFAARYNVGWAVCRTPQAAAFFAADPGARVIGEYRDGAKLTLIEFDRPHSYVLRGRATVERAERDRLVLTDLVPDAEGNVVLSYHYQAGFRCVPESVGVGPDPDLDDPIPMTRLRLSGPASRAVVVWTKR